MDPLLIMAARSEHAHAYYSCIANNQILKLSILLSAKSNSSRMIVDNMNKHNRRSAWQFQGNVVVDYEQVYGIS